MADKDQHSDEYHFTDADSQTQEQIEPESPGPTSSANPVQRNALIVVALVIVLYIIYRFIWPFFTGPKAPVAPANPPVVKTRPQPEPPKPIPAPMPVAQPVINQVDEQLKKQVSTLEVGQQGLRSDVTSLNSQLNSLNSKIDELANQINRLNQALTTLSNQVSLQSHEIQVLVAKNKPKKAKPKAKLAIAPVTYSIQALIPGRAWLIGSNGSILTVREGIKIKGYGVVQLIDAMQGRVVTSSGKIIRFSPEDS